MIKLLQDSPVYISTVYIPFLRKSGHILKDVDFEKSPVEPGVIFTTLGVFFTNLGVIFTHLGCIFAVDFRLEF